MRIPSGKTDQNIYFVAVDVTDLKTRETGLTSFTVYRSRNGGAATAYTTPTVSELSAANMPGVYALTVDEDTTIAAASDSEEYCVHITQAAMAPVTRVIELYRRDTTTGRTLAVDANSRVDVGAVLGTAQTAGDIIGDTNDIQSRLPAALVGGRMAANAEVVGDKTGYSLTTAEEDAIVNKVWDELTAEARTAGSFGQLFKDNVNATISSRSSHSAADIWAVATRRLTSVEAAELVVAACNKIADHVLRRTYANARASSDGDAVNFRSLLGAVGKLVNKWAISGGVLTVYQEDDTTSTAPGGTQNVTGTAGADPITTLDTV